MTYIIAFGTVGADTTDIIQLGLVLAQLHLENKIMQWQISIFVFKRNL